MSAASSQAKGLSLALDSIATWGRFPKFCIDTYRWGDHFFNGYDTTYVVGTGYKFNTKVLADTWIDTYQFFLPNHVRMNMVSEPCTSVGVWLTYLAVSGGYTKNISHLFGSSNVNMREKFSFGFNCSLFAFNMNFINNKTGVKIKRFGPVGETFNPHLDFNGLHSRYFDLDLYYFFNHKKYSQAAAFGFSRKQIKSEGSWFAGLSFSHQEFSFDFNSLPAYIVSSLPTTWVDNKYQAKTRNLAVKCGYGYNWVFRPKWMLSVSESPTIGLKKGTINNPDKMTTTFTFSNQLRTSIVWNHKQWFAGAIAELNIAIVYDKDSAFQNSLLSGLACVGYRFNIW